MCSGDLLAPRGRVRQGLRKATAQDKISPGLGGWAPGHTSWLLRQEASLAGR